MAVAVCRDFWLPFYWYPVTLLPLGNRAALVVMISIPLSIFYRVVPVDISYTINQLSIVGLIVASAFWLMWLHCSNWKHWTFCEAGRPKKQAAIEATKQIDLLLWAVQLRWFWPSCHWCIYRKLLVISFRSLPMAVITTVLASLVVSLTIVPFLSSRLLKNHEIPPGNIFCGPWRRDQRHRTEKPFTLRCAIRASHWFCRRVVCGQFNVVSVGGFSLFPRSEKPQFLISIETPSSASLDETRSVARYVESELKSSKR